MPALAVAWPHHAQAAIEAGDLSTAARSVEQGHPCVREYPPYRGSLLVEEASLLLFTDEPAQAVICLDAAAHIESVMRGAWEFDARASLIRVLALRRLGQDVEARAALAATIGDLEQRAARLASSDLRASFLECVPVHAALLAGANDGGAIGQR